MALVSEKISGKCCHGLNKASKNFIQVLVLLKQSTAKFTFRNTTFNESNQTTPHTYTDLISNHEGSAKAVGIRLALLLDVNMLKHCILHLPREGEVVWALMERRGRRDVAGGEEGK